MNLASVPTVAAVAFGVVLLGLPRSAWAQEDARPPEETAEKGEEKDEGNGPRDRPEANGEEARAPEGGEEDEKEARAPAGAPAGMSEPELDRLLKYLDDLYRADSSIATMTLTVTKPRRTRTLRMKAWSRGTDRALIVIQGPARDRGTATLKVGKNLWNYLPKISRTIRIPPSMMLSSWMGSDFTNDDLVRESSLMDDFDGELVGRAPRTRKEDPEGWLLSLKAKEGTVGLWKRIEYVVSLDGKIPLRAKYYDRKGRLSRVMEFTDVREFDGRRIPARLELTPVDKEGHKTEMVYDDIRFDVDVPDSTFSLSRLERKR